MNDPFMNLKSSMKKSIFKDLSFSNERKSAVKEAIRTNQQSQFDNWNSETIIAILESVQHESKDGYNISIQLFQKNERTFQKNEGQLYTLLHLLENKEILTSNWINKRKYYSLNSEGKKYLATYKEDISKQEISLKHLIKEASL
ncbi:PadR family transcriptional regulator [Bacillus sp. DTU_2020_1000418_1_SI_GHA_SEK_038]|uniref:PadR family transcriptional regulator n=1 Tax=Bacillus sp. DTU_2020_1000418_1_SI_GHA_SEK_038 TaxID=3077585 RepID=UPI0028E77005|nr:PadR family transcriptional regulator [Bacillus sp. DTU_2020_1000418_1_SI_GHA_SEK_038]WNS75701.1 PadR family transcriptional regulator [Bacillus sp. DTU_2020_1000418_1_SI_GHA_SEK_038]